MSTSRQTVRDALVALLSAALVGTGLPAKTVTGSNVDSLAGLTPLVSVLSGASDRPGMTMQGNKATLDLDVTVFVLQSATGWTKAQAGDALDTIESLIAGVCEDNRQYRYRAPTRVLDVAVEGILYFMELIPIRVKLPRS